MLNFYSHTTHTQSDLKDLKLSVDTFGTKFDVILVDPPWEEYVRRAPGMVGAGVLNVSPGRG